MPRWAALTRVDMNNSRDPNEKTLQAIEDSYAGRTHSAASVDELLGSAMSTEQKAVDVLAPGETVDVIDLLAVCREFAVANSRGGDVFRLDVVSAAFADLMDKSERFGLLFEAWQRDDNETVPAATEAEVIEAMYAMRAALTRIGGAG
jgi:hypothetical protein